MLSKAIVASVLFMGDVSGKRPLYSPSENPKIAPFVSNDRPELQNKLRPSHPIVEAGTCEAQCLFRDDNNSWCFSQISPVLSTGWEWYQNVQDAYWNIQFRPFIETQLVLTSDFIIQRLFSNNLDFSVSQFKTFIQYSILFQNTGQVCLGFGWGAQPVSFEINTNFQLQDCYKVLIDDMSLVKPTTDVNGDVVEDDSPFTGKNAKYIDDCSTSSGTGGTIELENISFTDSISTLYILGGEIPDGQGCFHIANWTSYDLQAAWLGIKFFTAMLDTDHQVHSEGHK